jgi:uncharacterized protein DUF3224
MGHAKGAFKVSGMKDEPYEGLPGGGKLTRATGEQAYSGDIDGRGQVRWLMAYRPDGTAHFVGIWHVTATIDGRKGSFIAESVGEFDGSASNGSLTVLEGLADGELSGLRGQGTFNAPGGADATYDLDYEVN